LRFRVFDKAGNVIETQQHVGIFRSREATFRVFAKKSVTSTWPLW
jgi:hypothetical protein